MRILFLSLTLTPALGWSKITGSSVTKAKNEIRREVAQVQIKGPKTEIFLKYLSCSTKSEKETLDCVKALIPRDASDERQRRFVGWFIFETEINTVRECGSEELRTARNFPEFTKDNLCFEFKIDGWAKAGVAFFKKIQDRYYLYSFHY